MGVVNVTPDSFSDGGRFVDARRGDRARARAGSRRAPRCSTSAVSRPGPAPSRSTPTKSCAASLPVVARARGRRRGVPVSIDTTKAAVAAAALEAGAAIVNDVSGGTADPDMLRVVADAERDARRDAHAGHAAHDAAPKRTTTTSCARSATSCARGSTPRSPPACAPTRSSPTPASASRKTAEHNLALLARAPRARGAVEVPAARRRVAQVVPRARARRRAGRRA